MGASSLLNISLFFGSLASSAALLADGAVGHQQEEKAVVITYCDRAFSRIWPVFHDCYNAALGCHHTAGGGNRSARPSNSCLAADAALLDLGLEGSSAAAAVPRRHCLRPSVTKEAPATAHASRSRSYSFLQTRSRRALARLPPATVSQRVTSGLLRELAAGRSVLHLDADAFLLRDPWPQLRGRFPDADIVGSGDCAGPGPGNEYCGWYINDAFRRRHGNNNPLWQIGFMLNTGLTYFRSNPRTLGLVQAAAKAVQEGRSTNEQTSINEALAEQSCKWSTEAGTPSPGHFKAYLLLKSQAFVGHCRGGLKVVVLPFDVASRSLNASAMSFHPGGSIKAKEDMLPRIQKLCGAGQHERLSQ